MTLYNLKTDGSSYRITKFSNDLDVESSYTLSAEVCECPAGARPSCRHRQMLPKMLAEGLLDSGGFYDFNTGEVLVPLTDLPDGIVAMTLDDPVAVHNAIADAVGEPEAHIHPSVPKIDRRL